MIMKESLKKSLELKILPQPSETTCGPSCLHAIYSYYGDDISLEQVISEVTTLEGGGTLAVFLANHALHRGYSARIYTYNLNVFDPIWFVPGGPDIRARLTAQMKAKDMPKLHIASKGYLEFLDLGGEIRFEDLTTALIRKHLNRSIPIVTGLSSTYLYRSAREIGDKGEEDDVKGEPTGHFVVLCGYDREERTVLIADPFLPNPFSRKHNYHISIDRVLCSILLGVLTYDANFLIIKKNKGR
jgi:Peptidase_C39 like family